MALCASAPGGVGAREGSGVKVSKKGPGPPWWRARGWGEPGGVSPGTRCRGSCGRGPLLGRGCGSTACRCGSTSGSSGTWGVPFWWLGWWLAVVPGVLPVGHGAVVLLGQVVVGVCHGWCSFLVVQETLLSLTIPHKLWCGGAPTPLFFTGGPGFGSGCPR